MAATIAATLLAGRFAPIKFDFVEVCTPSAGVVWVQHNHQPIAPHYEAKLFEWFYWPHAARFPQGV
jgi:hypothetical protein